MKNDRTVAVSLHGADAFRTNTVLASVNGNGQIARRAPRPS
jgi:hypothetical protein